MRALALVVFLVFGGCGPKETVTVDGTERTVANTVTVDGETHTIIGAPDQGPSKSTKVLKNSCSKGDLEACTGLVHAVRKGSTQSLADARRAFKLACDPPESDAFACFWLGTMHEEGLGFPVDQAMALKYYQSGCEYGDMEQCLLVGQKYTEADMLKEANVYYRKGCDGDYALTCTTLAQNHDSGKGVEKNHPEALRLYLKSCDLGDGIGCTASALHYLAGSAGEKDPAQGLSLLKKGCTLGYKKACAILKEADIAR